MLLLSHIRHVIDTSANLRSCRNLVFEVEVCASTKRGKRTSTKIQIFSQLLTLACFVTALPNVSALVLHIGVGSMVKTNVVN